MCGIAGIIAPMWEQRALLAAAETMATTLYHRGPDAQGVWGDPRQPLALAHRRLSIQDLSPAGHQPMASVSGRFHIVFNGEIYNFHMLASELRQRGHRFRGHSDTEVLLAAMEEWGIEATLERSRGMFALAVWDQQACELILCRDRMGEKPLFFGWLENCFVFASELKAFHSVFHAALIIDENAMAAFFRFGYVPTPYSIYRNIFKLLPGTYLRIPVAPLPNRSAFHPLPGKDSISPKPYWLLETIAHQGIINPILDEDEAIKQLDALLRDTISQQKIADVPLGAFLSGGVDSSLVAAVMQGVSDKPINTFTIGFKETEFDEAPYARAIAAHLGTEHHEYYVSASDGLDLIRDLPKFWDEPFADSSQIPSLLVAKLARQQVTVCLTGDGGDELFCGYNRYFELDNLWVKQQRFPPWLRNIFGRALSTIPVHAWQSAYTLLKKISRNKQGQSNIGLKIHKFAKVMQADSKSDAYRYLLSYWQMPSAIVNCDHEAPSMLDRQPHPGMNHFIHDAMYWDQLGYLVDDNLVKGDRASMSVGLEARLPLLDHRIVEFSWRLPLAMKYRDGQSKWLLRQVLYRYVPKALIERPKMGFSVPVREWLKGPLKNWAYDLLHSNNIGALCGVNRPYLEKVWHQHQEGSHDHSHKLWALCVWMAWDEQQRHPPASKS
ncbi:MAG: asparagine synthase (glutamine-hydrolyzing) [Desulfobulbaceae bacterium]|nr:asparagine synthase (glutamine-hydrolyzing) [Desulfobulbaceae bacterium]